MNQRNTQQSLFSLEPQEDPLNLGPGFELVGDYSDGPRWIHKPTDAHLCVIRPPYTRRWKWWIFRGLTQIGAKGFRTREEGLEALKAFLERRPITEELLK